MQADQEGLSITQVRALEFLERGDSQAFQQEYVGTILSLRKRNLTILKRDGDNTCFTHWELTAAGRDELAKHRAAKGETA